MELYFLINTLDKYKSNVLHQSDVLDYCALTSQSEKEIPKGIDLKIIDTFEGEIDEGIFRLPFSNSGWPGGGTIVLSYKKREVKINIDPVVGATIIK